MELVLELFLLNEETLVSIISGNISWVCY